MSAFTEVPSLEEGHFVVLVKDDETPKKNQIISKENLLLAIGVEAWFDGGIKTVADFQAGSTVGGDPMVKEIDFITLPVGAIMSKIVLVNEANVAGPSLGAANIEILNDSNDYMQGNLLDDWQSGASNPNLKSSNISYMDKSGKILTTGIETKLRLTTDINVSSLTDGSFKVMYKLENLPIDSDS